MRSRVVQSAFRFQDVFCRNCRAGTGKASVLGLHDGILGLIEEREKAHSFSSCSLSCTHQARMTDHFYEGHRAEQTESIRNSSACAFRGFASQAAKEETSSSSSSPNKANGDIEVDLVNPFKLHLLDQGPPSRVHTSKDELMQMYRLMTTLRRMELAADMLFKRQQIRGFCHLYDGQEAISVGMEAALTFDDAVLTAYRDHGIFIGRGGTVFEAFSELMGRRTGCAKGKGGSMHLYKRENNYYGGWGIVGTSGPLGTGLGFALKYSKKPNVAVAIYGDGAANQGQVVEAQNMAALWDLPVIYLVENNHYGMGTAEWRASKKTTFFDRLSYIPGIKVDGMDVFSVKAAMLFAKEHSVSGKGPIVVECDTYRYHGHSMSDPGSTYRTRDEIQNFRQERDPIERISKIIIKEGIASADELKQVSKEIRRDVEEQAAKGQEAPLPEEHELFSHIYRNDAGLVTNGCDRRKKVELH